MTVAAASLGFASGHWVLFPVACMAPAYPLMAWRLLAGCRRRAILGMLVWAATLGPTTVALSLWAPEQAAETVFRGEVYASEMFHWIETGEGAESRPKEFLVEHALHLGAFVVLSLATASMASIFFGTLLLNYMAYYVAPVIAAAHYDLLGVAMAWHPWSIVRVMAFVVLGVVLAEPLLRRLAGRRGPVAAGRWLWIGLAAGGLVVDAVAKAALAPYWRESLLGLTR
jgi:hypothetical protein